MIQIKASWTTSWSYAWREFRICLSTIRSRLRSFVMLWLRMSQGFRISNYHRTSMRMLNLLCWTFHQVSLFIRLSTWCSKWESMRRRSWLSALIESSARKLINYPHKRFSMLMRASWLRSAPRWDPRFFRSFSSVSQRISSYSKWTNCAS